MLSGTRLEQTGRTRDGLAPRSGAAAAVCIATAATARSRTSPTAVGLDRVGLGVGVCAGDYDNDGWIDLFVTYFGRNVLYRNAWRRAVRGRHRSRRRRARDAVRWGSGCSFIDYDRDGDLDLFVANYLRFDLATAPEPGQGANCVWKGMPVNCGPKGLPTDTNLLYRNRGDGTFEDVSEASGVARVTGRYPMTAIAADLDDDGWTDHLRRVGFDGGDSLSQQPRRHVHRRRAAERRGVQRSGQPAGRHGRGHRRRRTATAGSIC